MTNLGKYLGTPSMHGRMSTNLYQNLLDKISYRMESLKMRDLSLAGRHNLVQSVIISIPFFHMQTTLLPIGLCNIIDKKVRKFLWGDTNEKRRTHLIKWDMVTKYKQ